MATNKKNKIENRKFSRFPVINEYTLILDGKKHQGVIGNISLGGVYLSSISPSITEENLLQYGDIMMDLSGTEVSIPCKICFVEIETEVTVNSAGISFFTMNERAKKTVTGFIENIQRVEYENA